MGGPRPAGLQAVRLRAAAVLDTRPRIESDVLPTCARYGDGRHPWSPLAGGLAVGPLAQDASAPSSTRAERLPGRYDMSLAR